MAKTDNRGHFCVPNFPVSAKVGLEMSAPGYARALAEGPFVPEQTDLRFVLPPEGRIEGTLVAQQTGKPLPNVRLRGSSGIVSGH